MRVEAQAPIIGSAVVGGIAQSYLIKKYPQWSWILSLGLIGGGIFLGTKTGWKESIGLGVAAAGASGLGTALIPVGTSAGRTQIGSSNIAARMQQAANVQRQALIGAGSRYPAPVRENEFEGVRLR